MKIPLLSSYRRMWQSAFRNDSDGLAKSRRKTLAAMLAETTVTMLVEGFYYTALIVMLLEGATDSVYTGYMTGITAVANLAVLFQLLSPILFSKFRFHKKPVLLLRGVYYFANIVLPAIVILPFPLIARANIFVITVFVKAVSGAVSQPALLDFRLGVLTPSTRGDYFSVHSAISLFINGAFGLAVSFFMDELKANGNEFLGIVVLRGVALLFIAIEFFSYSRVVEFPKEKWEHIPSLREIFIEPLRDKPFLLTVFIYIFCCFSSGLLGNFYSAYLIGAPEVGGAGVSYTYINLILLLCIPIGFFISIPLWNKVLHKIGWYRTMMISGFLYSTCHAINAFVTPDTKYMYIVSGLFCQLVNAGYTFFTANLPFLRLPEKNREGCLALFYVLGAGATVLANTLGGVFIDLTNGINLHLFGLTLVNDAYISLAVFALWQIPLWLCFFAYRSDKKRGVPAYEIPDTDPAPKGEQNEKVSLD